MNLLEVLAPDGVPEVRAGDDLVALLLAALDPRDGDVLVVTSKVVSKAAGRVRFVRRFLPEAFVDKSLRKFNGLPV